MGRIMEKETQLILDAAHSLFLQRGFRSVTMDDIASHLKVSKKTIYKAVGDKNALVTSVVNSHIDETQGIICQQCANEKDAVSEMLSISQCISRVKKSVSQSIYFELEKYFPEAFKLIENHRDNFVKELIKKN